jgi:dihydrolipoamide dehydrogenase
VEKYDLIVIGAGPGGYEAAIKASALGHSVLLIEKDRLGGTCANKGCIPTKSLLHCAKAYAAASSSQELGVEVDKAFFNLQKAMAWKEQAVESVGKGVELLLKNAGVQVLLDAAACLDAHHVQVAGRIIEADFLILATGSEPARPPIPGSDGPNVITSDEALVMELLPQSIAIIGGGVIGIELASFFSLIGVEVSVIEMLDEILPMCDRELAKLVRRGLDKVSFNLGCKVTQIDSEGVQFTDSKQKQRRVDSQLVLMSIGRSPVTKGLEALGLETARGYIAVDSHMRTRLGNVFAIGDVNGKSMLAHSASAMAEVAVSSIFGSEAMSFDPISVPWAVYSHIEAAGCGPTEDQMKSQMRKCLCASVPMRSNGRVLAELSKRAVGSAKMICDMDGTILGIHIVGPYASELIWGASVLISSRVNVKAIRSAVFSHPSVSEVILECARAIEC